MKTQNLYFLYSQIEMVQMCSGLHLYEKLSRAVMSFSCLTLQFVHPQICTFHCLCPLYGDWHRLHEKWCGGVGRERSLFPHQSPECNKLLCSSERFKRCHIFLPQLFTEQTDWWQTQKSCLSVWHKDGTVCMTMANHLCSRALAMSEPRKVRGMRAKARKKQGTFVRNLLFKFTFLFRANTVFSTETASRDAFILMLHHKLCVTAPASCRSSETEPLFKH